MTWHKNAASKKTEELRKDIISLRPDRAQDPAITDATKDCDRGQARCWLPDREDLDLDLPGIPE